MTSKRLFSAAAGTVLGASAAFAVPSPIVSIPDLNSVLETDAADGHPFVVTGAVQFCSFPRQGHTAIDLPASSDESRRFYGLACRETCRLGDVIELRGKIGRNCDNRRAPVFDALRILSHHEPYLPVTGTHFFDDEILRRHVILRGIVRECYRDETVPNWSSLVLFCDGRCVNATLFTDSDSLIRSDVLGRKVELAGWVAKASLTPRKSAGRVLVVADPTYMKILDRPSTDAFDVPALAAIDPATQPEELLSLGLRRLRGTVLAVWSRNKVLVRRADGLLVNLVLDEPDLPAWGAPIVAVGLPTTNFYHLQLEHARWRTDESAPARARTAPEQPPAATGKRAHGQTVRIEGTIRYLSNDNFHDRCAFVESDRELIPIDLGSVPDVLGRLSVDCRIAATGICLIERTSLSPTHRIPTVQGIRLAIRRPEDLTILSRPSLWTPVRAATAAGVLLLLLLGVTIWNAALRRVATRKGRALAREQISRAEAELRIDERTRLAIELHDTLSQNLMGVAMRLDAVVRAISPCGEQIMRKITLLSNSIKYCREELRQCLWDLRSTALEAPNMNEVLRQALAPHIGTDAAVAIRFNVPRNRLTDKTLHALVRIIRELTLNALHHGHAAQIKIAGSFDAGTLHFSVTDNGCGFDLAAAPGIREGHFGLQGIRERVNLLGGSVTVTSESGKGTKVTVNIRTAHNQE